MVSTDWTITRPSRCIGAEPGPQVGLNFMNGTRTNTCVGRIVAGCMAAGVLSGCSGTQFSQPGGQARILTEGYDRISKNDGPIAARILPYALLSGVARDPQLNNKLLDENSYPPRFSIACKEAAKFGCDNPRAMEALANRVLRRYKLIRDIRGPLRCNSTKRAVCTKPVNGLGIQIWKKAGANNRCSEVVFVFRGTDAKSLGDWLSNLHWVTRILPLHDQYEQVQDHLPNYLNALGHCRRAPVVAIGHSLGGGLAQHAAFVDPRIKRVYVFNPSVVTGSSDRHVNWEIHRRGLTIERIYEHGEILAYLRYVQRQFLPPTRCNPRIVHVRFNRLHGNFLYQHTMHDVNIGLLKAAQGKVPEKKSFADQPCSPAGRPVVAGR